MSGFVYKGRTGVDIALHILESTSDDETYLAVLGTLANGIRTAKKRIDDAVQLNFEHLADPLIDIETQLIENLLGAIYVVCQAQITAVAQAAVDVGVFAKAQNITISGIGAKRYTVHSLGPVFKSGPYSKVEILWALGNYFKHHDEWPPGTWQNPPNQPIRRTVETISAGGLQESSSGNLRTGAKALGNTQLDNMAVFGKIIEDWSSDVLGRAHKALGR